MSKGFILLSRTLLDNNLWRLDSDHLRLWVYLLLKVNYSDKKFVYGHGDNKITVKKGELLKSYRHISEDCSYSAGNRMVRWSTSRVGRMMQILEDDGRIEILSQTQLGTLIKVSLYEHYQSFSTYKGNGMGTQAVHQSIDISPNNKEDNKIKEITKELWEVWLSELSPKPPHPKLTAKRAQCLNSLYEEQLKESDDPTGLFKRVLKAVQASKHHMKTRAYQLPESLFRNFERRERWVLTASETKNHHNSAVSRTWRVDQ